MKQYLGYIGLIAIFSLFFSPASMAGTYEDAVDYYNLGNMEKASCLFDAVIKEAPNNLIARFYLANSYSSMGLTQNAIDEYRICAQKNPGTKMEGQCLKAIEQLNKKLNGELKLKSPHRLLQMKSEIKIEGQASEYKIQLEKQCSIELANLKRRLAEDHWRLDQQLKKDINDIFVVGERSDRNPVYKNSVEALNAQVAKKKLELENRLKTDCEVIIDRYNKRLQAYSNSREGLRVGLNSSNGNMQIVPHGTSMTVRNYINFGQEKIYEPPTSMQATAGSINDKLPELSRAQRIRQAREQARMNQLRSGR